MERLAELSGVEKQQMRAERLMFFGCSCLAVGYLAFASGFLPKTLGLLMAIAGACYLVDGSAVILSPRLASMLFPSILLPAFIGELSFAGWLMVKGVNVATWQERCPASGSIS